MLKIFAILDEFSSLCLAPDCQLMAMFPGTWQAQLEDIWPDLVLVESAWRGPAGAWREKLTKHPQELLSCLLWCRKRGIPTVFWNKEDPVHFGTFLGIAAYFDFVFTTDIDCIPRYIHKLGHRRVGLLPFAAQPVKQRPLYNCEIGERRQGFCFAGAWYERYPARQQDFRQLIRATSRFGEVVIYDRNASSSDASTRFPKEFRGIIRGGLVPDALDVAYRGYRFAINVNTVKHSQTMFARRVYELLASNTVVISNSSRGMDLLFGGLVLDVESEEGRNTLTKLVSDETEYRKHALAGLRAVLREHTYGHRLDYLRKFLAGEHWKPADALVMVVAVADSERALRSILSSITRQSLRPTRAVIHCPFREDGKAQAAEGQLPVELIADKDRFQAEVEASLPTVDWVSHLVPDDVYGPHFLRDLTQADHYASSAAFGKAAYYRVAGKGCELVNDGTQYRPAVQLSSRSALLRRTALWAGWLDELCNEGSRWTLSLPDMLAIDEFHYCENGQRYPLNRVLETIGDRVIRDIGVSLADDVLPVALQLSAADVRPPVIVGEARQFTAGELFEWLRPSLPGTIRLTLRENELILDSTLAPESQIDVQATPTFTRAELNFETNHHFRLIAEHDLEALGTLFAFLDADGKKLDHTVNAAGATYSLLPPAEARHLRFALRVRGPGTARISALVSGLVVESPVEGIGAKRRVMR